MTKGDDLQAIIDKYQRAYFLENLTIKTAEVLDEKFGPLGELGIDIMIDRKGNPWLLEANANPGRIAA